MNITFLGGADEVGASGILVETGGRRVLVDCGIRPSPKAHAGLAPDQLPNLSQIESGSGKLDAILVTHAHTDHTGALELVVERFPDIPVYATRPTLVLTRVLHQDARRIMQTRLDEEGELPLFDDLAVQRLMEAIVPVPFRSRTPLADTLAMTFFPAGHIAGAAMIGLESEEGRLLISGDLSISSQRSVDGAKPPAFFPDALILESTYGGRLHANRAVQERKLVETVAEVTAQGGKVLIPAFALGRAQEILLILDEYQRRGELPGIPIWADGMVRAICQAYASFGEALPLPLQERKSQFFNERIRPVASSDQRNAILWEPGPAVIVASSGMLAGGPSLTYARALASSPQHAILLTGYQDEESPGRRLQELGERGAGAIRLGPSKVDVQCRLATYALSAHADEGQLISLAETLGPEHIFLVHGDETARASLGKSLEERGRIVHLPQAGSSVQLTFDQPARFHKPDRADDPRARQEELARQRRQQMQAFAGAAGQWLSIKTDPSTPVRCLALEGDRLWVEIAPGLEQPVYPEEVLAVLGEAPPADLASLRPPSAGPTLMEPNQALAVANAHFPAQARLRKCGYRLAEQTLVLTFDFPEAAQARYAGSIAALGEITGWQVEVTPEANQNALNALARQVLPADWQIVKGPAIHRDQKRVAVTGVGEGFGVPEALAACEAFFAASGWELSITQVSRSTAPLISAIPAGSRMEVNAAYAHIRAALEGSTLYRTSLKGEEIMLSFISRQVGYRYQDQIAALAQETGWPLSINSQPNQGAILEAARLLLAEAGLSILKGPSIYPEKAEVSVTLAASPEAEVMQGLAEAFMAQTGFGLLFAAPKATDAAPRNKAGEAVEIPLRLVRLRSYHQSVDLDAVKLEKAVARARMLGITPPIQVRRLADGYLLNDGLYRLRAAESLGLERIPAIVE